MEATTNKMFAVTVSEATVGELVSREGLMQFNDSDDRQVSIDTETATFNRNDVITFVSGKSKLYMKQVRADNPDSVTPVCVVFVNGKPKLFYHQALNRIAVEAYEPVVAGEVCKLSGRTFQANREGFLQDGEETLFMQIMKMFKGIKSAYESLANNNVKVMVTDTTRVKVRRYGDDCHTRNQKLMNIEFAYDTEEELKSVVNQLILDAEHSKGRSTTLEEIEKAQKEFLKKAKGDDNKPEEKPEQSEDNKDKKDKEEK